MDLDSPRVFGRASTATYPAQGPADLLDLRISRGKIVEIGRELPRSPGEEELDADGRWAIPGLWDAHVHMQQWAMTVGRLDVSSARDPEGVTSIVDSYLQRAAAHDSAKPVVGFGYRATSWTRRPTSAELDAVTGRVPVVLISGDLHSAWLNSAAQRLCGVGPVSGLLVETEWFDIVAKVEAMEPVEASGSSKLRRVVASASSRGVVGITDMEFEAGPSYWAEHFTEGIDALRVRTAVYPDSVDAAISAGLRTGRAIAGTSGLATMGPLKVIFDGSLNTATAHCCDPYSEASSPPGWTGVLNYSNEELNELCELANRNGLEVALHAIGDAAVTSALDAIERTGARGSLEHAQLIGYSDLARFAKLGVRASVQPAHLIDDRDATHMMWLDRQERTFVFRSLIEAGAQLAFGSDAPVAPLDPWLAMAAAVHRSGDERAAWNPAQSLDSRQALAASVDGQRLRVGGRGDIVLLDDDPLASQSDTSGAGKALSSMRVSATIVAGRGTHMAL